MRLAEIQHALQSAVLKRESPIATAVQTDDPDSRIGIYRSAYAARIEEALAATYPTLQTMLGARDFTTIISDFSVHHPSRVRSIRDYGGELGDFIGKRIHGLRGRGLAELAHWEWSLAAAFDAPDSTASTIDLTAVAPEYWSDLTFEFAGSLQRLTLRTNAVQVWRATQDGLTAPWQGSDPADWALWRCEMKVLFRSLPTNEARALDLARQGQDFGSICEALVSAEQPAEQAFVDAAMQAATFLRAWIADGWVVSIANR
jgi:hypothetical protein